MDNKTKEKKLKEFKKMNKTSLRIKGQDLIDQHDLVSSRLKELQRYHASLTKSLVSAYEADDEEKTSVPLIKSQLEAVERELETFAKREKALTEEIELVSRALKNDFEGGSARWSVIGSWVAALGGLGLSGYGMWKSHKTFEDGTMVDKTTKSAAERLKDSVFNMFKSFGRK